jgi:hypothetical protein
MYSFKRTGEDGSMNAMRDDSEQSLECGRRPRRNSADAIQQRSWSGVEPQDSIEYR